MKFVSAAMLLVPTLALAQPSAGGDEPPPPQPPPQPIMQQPPPPPPQPPPPMASGDATEEHHPAGLAFAIGLGYIFPTSLETPNVTSVRVRLPGGLTFEPRVAFANESQKMSVAGTDTTTSTTELGLGALIRYPVIKSGRVDLEAVGSVDLDNTKVDPDGADNNTTTTTLSVSWGLSINYWFTKHWNLSLTAENPLFSYTKQTQEQAGGMETTSSTTNVGLIFEPVVFLMVHLYN